MNCSIMEAITLEVVCAQILAVVVCRHIVNVALITILDVIEEEMSIGKIEDELFHSLA